MNPLLESHTFSLLTSNAKKLAEFERIGVPNVQMRAGHDLPEVDSPHMDTVALYKSLEAGAFSIIEDSSLHVQGAHIGTQVRWHMDALHDFVGAPVTFSVMIALNDGTDIYLYEGHMRGHITLPKAVPPDAFGFDPFVIPEGTSFSLYDLEHRGQKDAYSARSLAIGALCAGNHCKKVPISSIAPWQGAYQAEESPKQSSPKALKC